MVAIPCGFDPRFRHQTLTARKPLIYRGLRAVLYALHSYVVSLAHQQICRFQADFRRDIEHYAEGYTPKIALADATFEVKFRCVYQHSRSINKSSFFTNIYNLLPLQAYLEIGKKPNVIKKNGTAAQAIIRVNIKSSVKKTN